MKGKSLRVVSGPSQLIYGTLGALSHGTEQRDKEFMKEGVVPCNGE